MIESLFYIAAVIALSTTALALSRANATHALIYLIVSLLAVAVIFFLLGAPFAAALEVLIYAGAIMVLFVFVIMMLNLGEAGVAQERQWLQPRFWLLPGILAAVLLLELLLAIQHSPAATSPSVAVAPKAVGLALYGPYVLAVEIASLLLLAGLVGAYHLGRRFLARPTAVDPHPQTDDVGQA
ncbi:NADH-quinone oxidoreductase subunit J [Pseudomaricurvus alcaniphilus]|uniref:NADH-quinone oxidoreductase subunit J n=1 Tax=Pseudomaricurvus alcaniphilus TaxID=1166482 RepID=UPI001A9EB2A6|nr:NADH-quinone oxidoreductase subunit J [Pseudomaricurvus alcaniphilus]